MRFAPVQWLLAATAALLLHASLLLAWQSPSEGAASPPPGPSLEMANSIAGILGEAVEIEADTEAPREVHAAGEAQKIAVAETVEPPKPLQSEPPPVEAVGMAAMAPLDPVRETVTEAEVPAIEPEAVETRSAILLPPRNAAIRQRKEDAREDRSERRELEAKKKAERADKRGDGKRRAAKRGSGRTGQTGSRATSGGSGSGSANPGAIASFKSQVRARIAGCVRSRVSGRGSGRVVIRFGVTSGGGASAVSVSGSSTLTGAAAAAARGCSFPTPPRGAGGLRFAFPVTVGG